MAARIGTAAVALPALAGLVWAGGPWFAALVSAAALVASFEASALLRLRAPNPVGLAIMVAATALPIAVYFAATGRIGAGIVPITIAGSIVLNLGAAWFRRRSAKAAVREAALATGAVLFTGGLLSYGILLRDSDAGRAWVYFALGVLFASDTFALFVGRYTGRLKMAPSISPGKTWEGAAGGLAAGIGAGIALKYVLGLDALAWQIAVVAVSASVVGQIGDLAESKLKRVADVKDSGQLLPGHGGLLDRIDSIVVALPVMYYFLIWWIQ